MWGNFTPDLTGERRQRVIDPYDPDATVWGPWSTAETFTVPGGYVAASSSTANSDATRTEVLTSKSLFCPADADVRVGDRFLIDGAYLHVNARPLGDVNPFTGWAPDIEVPLDLTEG